MKRLGEQGEAPKLILRLSRKMLDAAKAVADKEGVTVSEIARMALEDFLSRRGKPVSKDVLPRNLEVDSYIAEKVFGWKLVTTDGIPGQGFVETSIHAWKDPTGTLRSLGEVPAYSSHMTLAHEVVVRARAMGLEIGVSRRPEGDSLILGTFKGKSKYATAETPEEIPSAICNVVRGFLEEER
jgi:hypothetical protein